MFGYKIIKERDWKELREYVQKQNSINALTTTLLNDRRQEISLLYDFLGLELTPGKIQGFYRIRKKQGGL